MSDLVVNPEDRFSRDRAHMFNWRSDTACKQGIIYNSCLSHFGEGIIMDTHKI